MRLYFSLLVLFAIGCTSVVGQSLARRAKIAYEEKNYKVAADCYERYEAKKDMLLPEMYPYLANSYYYLNEYEKAEKVFKKTRRDLMDAQMFYNYAEMLRRQSRYDESIAKYRTALSRKPDVVTKQQLKLGIAACQWAIENDEKMAVTAQVLESEISVPVQSLGLSYYKNGLVFSSFDSSAKKIAYDGCGRPILNLYILPSPDSSAKSQLFSKNIKAKNHVGSPTFTSDFNTVYFTRLVLVDGSPEMKLFTAHFDEKSKDWIDESELSFCLDYSNYAHPALSNDDEILYFASDMKGTLGGMDIFYTKQTNGKWAKPRSMGKMINTAATEVFPSITPQGDLFFSSNGHPGFGGLDVFFVKMKNKRPVSIFNANKPVNSSYDDFSAVISPYDSHAGFVSSNRKDGKNDQIYQLTITDDYELELAGANIDSLDRIQGMDSLSLLAEDSTALLNDEDSTEVQEDRDSLVLLDDAKITEVKGSKDFVGLPPVFLYELNLDSILNTYFVDALSLEPLKGGHYEIIKKSNNDVLLSGDADFRGRVTFNFKEAKIKLKEPLLVSVVTEGGEYNTFSLELVSESLCVYDENNPILLTPLIQKKERDIETIVMHEETIGDAAFEFGESYLTAAGEQYMDAWAEFLLKNKDIRIKLKTHTDKRGNVAYNFKLSQQRAFEAKRYLISKGVNHLQVIGRGYGERYPLIKCVKCTEKEYSINRRIEIEVVKIN